VRPANGGQWLVTTGSGVGVPGENLTRTFHHGFATGKYGHGFRLHAGR
jgi:hypothetical protein